MILKAKNTHFSTMNVYFSTSLTDSNDFIKVSSYRYSRAG